MTMSDSLRCDEVDTRRDQKEFLHLERVIYRDDPHWVPPLWFARKEAVGFKYHPFYNDADRKAWVVRRGDKVVGRILAIINHAHNRRYEEKRGFFGFYECFDDLAASNELFTHACRWLKSQGMTDVRGPANPSLNYECGLLIDGFDSPPTFMIPHHRDYYGKLVEAFGFEKTEDLFSYQVSIEMLNNIDPKLKFVIDEATKRFKVSCRPISRKNFAQDVRQFLNIYNLSLERTWGYVPMSESEVDHMAKGLKYMIVPELTSLAEIDGRAVGAGFGLLDYNEVIGKIGGRLFPFGWWKLLTAKGKISRLRLISTNVLPEYQRWGLGLATLAPLLPVAIKYNVKWGEFSWVLESNSLSRGTIERGGATRFKTHRMYDRSLTDL
jgi:GNAT superfamily N-acetyltransferase